MRKKIWILLLAAVMLLCLWGCSREETPETSTTVPETTAEPTVPPTVPEDGNPENVTCKGSYTGQAEPDAIVAVAGEKELSNAQLSAWYWAMVGQYSREEHDVSPDFSKPLDTQVCPIDNTVNSWQQYFLRQALNAWHSAQALELVSQADGAPVDSTYKPVEKNHVKYMTGMPATSVLHGYNKPYRPNSLHQAYLDGIPQLLEDLAAQQGFSDAGQLAKEAFGTTREALEECIRLYNFGYMYFTQLSYNVSPTEGDIQAHFSAEEAEYARQGITKDSGCGVDIRHILVTDPDSGACMTRAQELLDSWARKYKKSEATFAELARKNSQDTGSVINGGSYRNVQPGQLADELDQWCFDPQRQSGDTTIIETEQGCHILYFSGKGEHWYTAAQADVKAEQEAASIYSAILRFPARFHYESIVLPEARGSVACADFLYPDIAHERYPEVPLYLQQDYQGVKFGAYELRTHGCGITTMSMLASYMTDDEWTPPEMCARYSNYSYANGTDGMIFINEPAVMGFYLREKTYEPTIAKKALEDGHIVLSIQHKGYWTSGGHYLLMERITEDGMIQVRDSNIFNYGKIKAHKEDKHTWGSITSAGSGYWVFEYKITQIPACVRCGDPEQTNAPLVSDYLCEKCVPALIRRNAWLEYAK